ncbi:MarR family winged helix-turn-helix transcriptional regulator [Bacillus songklensis]
MILSVDSINKAWTDLYYYLHYKHEESLTHQNIRCMQTIEKNKRVTIQLLSEVMGISHNTASEHIKRLMQKGYVQKERNLEDKRIVQVKLTTPGKEALKRNTELDEQKLQVILERLSVEDQAQVLKAFELLSKEARHVFSS